MALPTSTVNGATATINGIVYTYNSTKGAWYKQSTASTSVPVTISGTLSVSGNANVGNLGSPTVVNGNSNVTVTANGNITFTSTSNSTMVVSSTGANITGTANVSGNVNVGNLITTGTANVGSLVSYTGGAISGDFSSNYTSAPASQDAGRMFSISNRTYLAGASYGAADTRVIDFGIGPANVAYLRATGSNGFSLTVSSLSVSGNILPSANITYNLGSTTLRWSTVYTGDLELSNGIGDYTIVEGEDDLFLYNNRSGKTYRFMLQEVDPAIVPPKKGT